MLWFSFASVCILLYSIGVIASSPDNVELDESSDELYILLDEISIYSCRGVKNEIKLSEEDVNIVNENGNRAYFIKAPGNYSLQFKQIKVLDDFGYLSGELSATLQVPILEGPAGIRFDLPYTMIPETGLLSQRCDEYSGIVERDGRQYCRYCDLCELSEKIENGLNRESGHEFLPEVVKGNEERFAPKCSKIITDTYQFKRTISLPGRRELTAKVRDQMQGLDGEIKKRLNKGRGRFQVFLNLISAQQPPLTHDQWFDSSSQCRCCGKHRDESCRSVLSFLYCDKEDCKSAWAQKCLHNSARIVACYTVEFNYRMTNSYDDVLQFLREKNLPNQDSVAKSLLTTTAPTKSLAGDGSLSARCVAEMPMRLVNLRRYCTIFWNQSLCCSHCEGIC